jgi:hypothetical protein
MTVYDRYNPRHVAAVIVLLYGSLFVIGYITVVLKDNRGRFRIATFIALMTAIAIFIVVVRLLLLTPV